MKPAGRVAVAAACVTVGIPSLGGCTGEDEETIPAPVTSPTTSTTTRPDYTQIALPVMVSGTTTTTTPRARGTAAIQGKVFDGQGTPVSRALVRATYYKNPDRPETIELLTGDDGGYRFGALYGGRWRVTVWREPFHARLKAIDFFLTAGDQKTLDLQTRLIPQVAVTTAMAPDPPLIGNGTELAVRIVTQLVDSEGRVHRSPVVGTDASLSLSNGWSIRKGENPLITDTKGEARWELTCAVEGAAEAWVTFGGTMTHAFTMPSCSSASTTTTATAPPASTTSTKKPAPTATTKPSTRTTVSTRAPLEPRRP